jgi:hypothetical protein
MAKMGVWLRICKIKEFWVAKFGRCSKQDYVCNVFLQKDTLIKCFT